MYLFHCDQNGQHLAIRVNAGVRRYDVTPPKGSIKHPSVSGLMRGGSIEMLQHERDPDRALEAESRGGPLNVTVLILGNTLGDYGPFYPREQAVADMAAPFIMAVGAAALLDQASGGPARRAAAQAARDFSNCADCHGLGTVICDDCGGRGGSIDFDTGLWEFCTGCTANYGRDICHHPGLRR
jgi:hypothetical protein